MAESTVVAVPRDGTIVLTNEDAASYTVAYENGDFSYSEDRAERVVIYDRGIVVGLRSANDAIPSFSFTVHFREFMNAADATILDFVYKTNNQVEQLPRVERVLNLSWLMWEFGADMSTKWFQYQSNHDQMFDNGILFRRVPDSISLVGRYTGP